MKRLTLVAAALVAVLLVGIAAAAGTAVAKHRSRRAPVTIQILNVSDWHGNLDPRQRTSAARGTSPPRWQQDRLAHPNARR